MTLEQLRIFVAVAEREHVTRAADHLHLTQSAVSSAVTVLEREFQIALFDRIGRRIALTQAGHTLLAEARAVLQRADATRERLTDLRTLRGGVLHVHASHTIASYWLPARLNDFHERHPGIDLKVTIANTRDICLMIRSGDASLGLVEDAVTDAELASETVATDRLLLVVGPRHPWAAKPPEAGGLGESMWVLREPGSGTRSSFENALKHSGVAFSTLPVMMEIASNEAVASAVETGLAATVLSASVVAGRLEAGLLHHVPFPFPDREFLLVRHPRRQLSPGEAAFMSLLLDSPSTHRAAIGQAVPESGRENVPPTRSRPDEGSRH
ncbi:LysR family transcriptional regulator [Acidomonas methanolica]|uniref:Transcriptional regulator LysR n=1 Tax=Acidomonas methanolica NBRC 104435 TaxID=1231351 RepID=A0A023D9M5_ACIMT|nr:LysR family transcriptional regulator [Acidomonas methanolica]MBU2654845.1 LysR family transcriptional regulator [Acidomonas methanolica]TCS26511.1 LysR family transcriptional regulator [Acidomonas methanolica]GAJ30531.1 transcriptional regulator LysR [Acidomonas methanolica NBRC 104435]GBQ52145.1 LysR family transcriptional regulator [Acidomonas methanolica]GEL00755.1 LysR family transcriptional regulator [Acidomonas methanolica NBRC 104435]